MSEYTKKEIQTLITFHRQYPDPNAVRCCFYCHKQKPLREISQVPVQSDEDDVGTVFIDVCHTCMTHPLPVQLADYEQNLLA